MYVHFAPFDLKPVDALNICLGVAATILSVVAIRFAKVQHSDAKITLAQTRQALEKLDRTAVILGETALQLPTRYVGRFPANLPEITRLISEAEQEIVILSDFAGYGSFTAPGAFHEYKSKLIDVATRNQKLGVRMYVNAPAIREQIIRTQFKEVQYTTEKFGSSSEPCLKDYIERQRRIAVTVNSYESFVGALLSDEIDCLKDFQIVPRFDCFEFPTRAPMYIWMIDWRECIFSFENQPEKQAHFSFRTRDGRLIEYFKDYIDNLIANASAFVPPSRNGHSRDGAPSAHA